MVSVSGRGKTWTVERLQGAIKAAFFARGLELQRAAKGVALPDVPLEGVSLRYTELKKRIQTSEGPVADRTLARALSGLVANRHLGREARGRAVFYTLTIPSSEHLGAFARSDADAVQLGAEIGGIADLTDGWAYYGLPDLLKDRLRPRLRRAANAYHREIRAAVERVTQEVIHEMVREFGNRLPREEARLVEEALLSTIQLQARGWLTLVRGERLWSSLEAIIPGALAAWRRVLDVPDQATWDGQWTETKIQATAKGLGVHPDRLRRIVERETRKMGKTQASIDRFFELLGPEVGQQVSLQLRELVVVVGSLMAVIRP